MTHLNTEPAALLKALDEHAIVSVTDASGAIIECNDRFCRISGYSREELTGNNHRMLKSGIHPAGFYDAIWQMLLSGRTWRGEICNRHKNGSLYWVEASITPILDAQGLPYRYISIRTDITHLRELGNTFNQELVDSLPGIFYMLDGTGRFRFWNTHLEDVLQLTGDEITSSHPLDFFDGPDKVLIEANIRKVFEEGETNVEAMLVSKDGSRTPYHFTGKRIHRNGEPLLIGLGTDITKRKIIEEEAQKSSEELAAIFDSSKVSIAYVKNNVVIKTNRRFDEVFGYQRGELLGQSTRCLYTDEEAFHSVMAGSLPIMARSESYHRTLQMRRKNGTHFWARISGSALTANLSRGSVWTCEDVTVEHEAREQIRNMAYYDTLTQLPNRRMLEDRLSQALAINKRSMRYGALMFLDLDNFKPVNDQHGHAVGDLLLIEVAQRLRHCVRESDTVARFGGDEFVVIINELDQYLDISRVQAGIIAEKIREDLAEPYTLTFRDVAGKDVTVRHQCTSSIGIYMFINHEASLADILKWADMAMYEAKQGGRNQVRFYTDDTGTDENDLQPGFSDF